MAEKEQEKKVEPVKKVRIGNVVATVWLNEGEKGKNFSVSIERSYKDKKDEWQTTNSYNRNDLPKLSIAANLAYEWCFSEEAIKLVRDEPEK